MKVIAQARELKPTRAVCAAIGTFDGVHLGHQRVIQQTVADAREWGAEAVVVTFDRHPAVVVAPERVPSLLYTPGQKLRALESLGVDVAMVVPFDEPFSLQTGDIFIRGLVDDFGGVRSLCVGEQFVFGHRRSGDVRLLRGLGQHFGFAVHGLAPVLLDGLMISSRRIREVVQEGHFEHAGRMLGRPYALAGLVVRGDQVGRRLGFPTANLDVNGRVLPPLGVYVARTSVGSTALSAVVNIGCRPTLQEPSPAVHVEAHLLDFEGDLYGQELELRWVARLRDEVKFASGEALRDQIARDVAAARLRLAAAGV